MKILVVLLVLFCYTPEAFAAVAFDAATGNESDAVDTYSFSHTTSGTNRYLAVCVVSTSGQTVSTMTYNGVSLAQKTSATNGGTVQELWELAGPASGANTLAITLSASASNIRTSVLSFTGVDQATPSGTAATLAGGLGGGTASVDVTVVANGMAMDCFTVNGSGHSPAAGAGQTQQTSVGFAGNQQQGSSTSTDSGTNSMNWTWTTDDNFNTLIAVPIAPAAAAGIRRKPIVLQ